MGNVAVTYSILPDAPEADLDRLQDIIKTRLPRDVSFRGSAKKPVAFGLTALHVMFILPDMREESKEGSGIGPLEHLEEMLNKLPGVQSIDCVDTTLL